MTKFFVLDLFYRLVKQKKTYAKYNCLTNMSM